MLNAQYPNGAFPQQFSKPPDPNACPVMQASHPNEWPRTFPGVKYSGFYTFNDNVMGDVVEVMALAFQIYKDQRYLRAVERIGDFILRSMGCFSLALPPGAESSSSSSFVRPPISSGHTQSVLIRIPPPMIPPQGSLWFHDDDLLAVLGRGYRGYDARRSPAIHTDIGSGVNSRARE